MAAPLTVILPHQIGREEAKRRLKSGLARAASAMPMLAVEDETWDGDRMSFRVRALGQSAFGVVQIGEEQVRIEVTLPWLLQRFAQVAQAAIKARGRLLLDKPK